MSKETGPIDEAPKGILEFAAQAVVYVERSVGIPPTYDSETLPLVDHYLRSAKGDGAEAIELVATTVGAYFGEVVRRTLGGTWRDKGDVPELIMPGGVTITPIQISQAVILDAEGGKPIQGTFLSAPGQMQPHLESALERMDDLPRDQYFSLAGQYDILEHLKAVMLATAAKIQESQNKSE